MKVDMFGLQGKTALITGAGRGIGRALAEAYGNVGARLALFDRDLEPLNETNELLKAKGITDVILVQGDVTSEVDCKSLAGRASSELGDGSIDVINNIAGITSDNHFTLMKADQWDKVMAVNLGGAKNIIKAADPFMFKLARKESKEGIPNPRAIVNVSSVVGSSGNATQANYGASKGAIEGFTKCLAAEYAGLNIRVNAVAPGFVDTRLTQVRQPGAEVGIADKNREAALETVKRKTSVSREATPEEIADVILFLGSKMSYYVHGQIIVADGGLTTGIF